MKNIFDIERVGILLQGIIVRNKRVDRSRNVSKLRSSKLKNVGQLFWNPPILKKNEKIRLHLTIHLVSIKRALKIVHLK